MNQFDSGTESGENIRVVLTPTERCLCVGLGLPLIHGRPKPTKAAFFAVSACGFGGFGSAVCSRHSCGGGDLEYLLRHDLFVVGEQRSCGVSVIDALTG